MKTEQPLTKYQAEEIIGATNTVTFSEGTEDALEAIAEGHHVVIEAGELERLRAGARQHDEWKAASNRVIEAIGRWLDAHGNSRVRIQRGAEEWHKATTEVHCAWLDLVNAVPPNAAQQEGSSNG